MPGKARFWLKTTPQNICFNIFLNLLQNTVGSYISDPWAATKPFYVKWLPLKMLRDSLHRFPNMYWSKNVKNAFYERVTKL